MAETPLKFGFENEIVFTNQPFGICRAFCPDERTAVAGKGENCERTGRQEMFIGATPMRTFMSDVADNARLVIIPVDRLDASDVTQARLCAVGCNQQACDERFAICQLDSDGFGIGFEILDTHAFDKGDAEFICLFVKCGVENTVFNHMRERLTGVNVACKGEVHRADRIGCTGIGDNHFGDGLGVGDDFLPAAKLVEHPRGSGSNG